MRPIVNALLLALCTACGPTVSVPLDTEATSTGVAGELGSTAVEESSEGSGTSPVDTPLDSTSTGAASTDEASEATSGSTGGRECTSPALDSTDALQLGGVDLRGNPDGAVTIVEWLGFEDPFSNNAYWTIRELMDTPQFAGKLRLAVKHMPFDFHPHGLAAARAAIAAAMQGQAWAYHDLLFEYDGDLDADALEELALEAGLDLEQLQVDMDSREVDAQLQADRDLGVMIFGSLGTPSFVFNGARLTGAQPLDAFVEAVAAELAATEALVAGGQTLCEAYEERLMHNLLSR